MKSSKAVSWERRKRWIGFRFVLPFVIGSVLFIILPVIKSLLYSFYTLRITNNGFELLFKGLQNYKQILLVETTFRESLLQSLLDLLNVPVAIIFSFFIASLLNQKFHGRTLARGIMFLPVVLSSGILIQLGKMDSVSQMVQYSNQAEEGGLSITSAFSNMISQMNLNSGIINFLIGSVERISIIVSMSAIPIIIFLAGFQSISPSIFEAAYMEGATKWETFWKISFPMVSSLILVCVIYLIVDAFTNTSNAMINSIHNTIFFKFDFGLGNAMVWIYMLIIVALLGTVYGLLNRFIFYYE
jgi:ABC-type sugar transport system permease subunit